MKISKLICAPGRTGFFFDDQAAIKAGAEHDGFTYNGSPVLPGFKSIRQAGESLSILLQMEDGQIAYGDCAAVQYSGVGGRDPLFLAGDYIPVIDKIIKPRLEGREILSFSELASEIDNLQEPRTGGKLHTALRYGITQAILDAAAKATRRLMADVIAKEYGTRVLTEPVPIFAQSGDERYLNADKMILKRVPVLPHALINHVQTKLGTSGEILLEYVAWLRDRVRRLGPGSAYRPVFHIDVYGTIGLAFNHDMTKMLDYLNKLAETAAPYELRIEGPVDMGDQVAQVKMLKLLCALIDKNRIGVQIVADEWCNTLEDIKLFADEKAGHMIQIKTPDLGGINNSIEAVLYCRSHGVGAYLGGTCNETDRSAQVCVHVAMATGPDQILAKPGMGMDEGYMIVFNEMSRILAIKKSEV